MEFNSLQTIKVVRFGTITGEIIFLTIMLIYLVFAFILTRRIKIMNLNLTTPYGKIFEKLSRLHTFATLIVIIIALLSLKL